MSRIGLNFHSVLEGFELDDRIVLYNERDKTTIFAGKLKDMPFGIYDLYKYNYVHIAGGSKMHVILAFMSEEEDEE